MCGRQLVFVGEMLERSEGVEVEEVVESLGVPDCRAAVGFLGPDHFAEVFIDEGTLFERDGTAESPALVFGLEDLKRHLSAMLSDAVPAIDSAGAALVALDDGAGVGEARFLVAVRELALGVGALEARGIGAETFLGIFAAGLGAVAAIHEARVEDRDVIS